MFSAIRVEQPLWRANFLLYTDADLHQPRREGDIRGKSDPRYVRVERQSFRRLPVTGAVVFGIHTYVADINTLTPIERSELFEASGSE
jgi:hypothetical protein